MLVAERSGRVRAENGHGVGIGLLGGPRGSSDGCSSVISAWTQPSARPSDDRFPSSFAKTERSSADNSASGQPMNSGSRRPTLTNVSKTIDGSP